jgi:transposase-like protein
MFKFKCPNCGKTITEKTGCMHFPVRDNKEDPVVEQLKNMFNYK